MTLSPDDFMQLAVIEAKKALALNEVPVGAIVIKENKVMGAGFNSVIRDHTITAHAEINAINAACKLINNYRLVNCDLYVTLEPCHMCAKAIVDARIDNVYFAGIRFCILVAGSRALAHETGGRQVPQVAQHNTHTNTIHTC